MKGKAMLLTAILLTAVLCGCETGGEPTQPEEIVTQAPTEAPTEPVTEPVNMEAVDFLKLLYTEDNIETAVDYVMLDLFQADSGNFYKVIWSVDVSEDLVKIIPNEDGTVTVDVNELCQKDVPYTLTASIATKEGHRITHSWNYILPKVRDMSVIVERAYALKNGERLPGQYALSGTIIAIEKQWSDDYRNVSLSIRVDDCNGKTVRCYGLTGEGAETLQIGDHITVSGVLKKYNGGVEFDNGCVLEPSMPEETIPEETVPEETQSVESEPLTTGN